MAIYDGLFFDYCDAAVEYIEKRDIERTDESIEKATQFVDGIGVAGECPNYADVFFEIGNIWKDKGNIARAIEYYEKAHGEYMYYADCDREKYCSNAAKCCMYILHIDPDNVEAHRNMGLAFYGKEEYDIAIGCYNDAIKLKPDYVEAFSDMGIAYRFKKDYDKAVSCYEKALELDLGYAEAWNNMGIAYVDKGDFDKAIECYGKAAESNDADKAKVAYCNMGNAYKLKEDYEKAIESWEKAIVLDRYLVKAYHYIANAYKAIGNESKASEYGEKAERAGLMQFAAQLIGHG